MSSLEEELLADAAEDARAVAYIQEHLPEELKEKFPEDVIYYFLDLAVEYYAESGVLDAEPDKNGFVDINIDAVCEYLAAKAKKEGIGDYTTAELPPFVEAQLDFDEENF